jgi:hypothetical protein
VRHRLLAIDVDALVEGGQRNGRVPVIGSRDEHRIDPAAIEEFLVVCVLARFQCLRCCLVQPRLIHVAQCGDVHILLRLGAVEDKIEQMRSAGTEADNRGLNAIVSSEDGAGRRPDSRGGDGGAQKCSARGWRHGDIQRQGDYIEGRTRTLNPRISSTTLPDPCYDGLR